MKNIKYSGCCLSEVNKEGNCPICGESPSEIIELVDQDEDRVILVFGCLNEKEVEQIGTIYFMQRYHFYLDDLNLDIEQTLVMKQEQKDGSFKYLFNQPKGEPQYVIYY